MYSDTREELFVVVILHGAYKLYYLVDEQKH